MKKTTKEIQHGSNFGVVIYNDKEIVLKSNTKNPILISWDNIDFISTNPALKNYQQPWVTFNGIDLMADNALASLPFLHFDIVLKNKNELKNQLNWFRKLLWAPTPSPIMGINDQPDPMAGYLRIESFPKSFNVSLREFLDFIYSHARFNLLCH